MATGDALFILCIRLVVTCLGAMHRKKVINVRHRFTKGRYNFALTWKPVSKIDEGYCEALSSRDCANFVLELNRKD